MLPNHSTIILPSALSVKLLCDVRVTKLWGPSKTFCVRHRVQILIKNPLILELMFRFGAEQLASKVIAKVEN